VDEALTGLKSALAVKDLRPDLNVLQEKGAGDQAAAFASPRLHRADRGARTGPAQPDDDVDRDKIARYGINVADVEAVVQAAVGGQAATQVIQGEKLFDLVVRMKPEFRENAQQIGNLARRHAHGPADSPQRAGGHSRRPAARPSSIAKTIRATSACSTASKGRDLLAPSRTAARHRGHGKIACRPATGWPGAASTANSEAREPVWSLGRWPCC
jgi:hypothetical protein